MQGMSPDRQCTDEGCYGGVVLGTRPEAGVAADWGVLAPRFGARWRSRVPLVSTYDPLGSVWAHMLIHGWTSRWLSVSMSGLCRPWWCRRWWRVWRGR
jgi:hypothetical protein